MMKVMTWSDHQRQRWIHLFGLDCLPVVSGIPDHQSTEAGAEVITYRLAMGQLSLPQKARLAGHLSRASGRPYDEVRDEVLAAGSWPIDGRFCYLIEDEGDPLPFPV